MTTSKCFPQFHMSPAEFGFWNQCMALTHGGRDLLFFDGRKMALRFGKASKSMLYRLLESTEENGWLVEVKNPQPRRADGTKTSSHYRVLTHEQWSEKHGKKKCSKGWKETLEDAQPVPQAGQVHVPSTGLSCPTGGLGLVPRAGHSIVKTNLLVKDSFVQSGAPSEEPTSKDTETGSNGALFVAHVPSTGQVPVPRAGQAVLCTPAEDPIEVRRKVYLHAKKHGGIEQRQWQELKEEFEAQAVTATQ